MNEQFVRNRLTELRMKKGVSEYKMSLDLGHSKSYMQSISSGRALPSLSEFLYICDYLGVSPKEFFDEAVRAPASYYKLCDYAKRLPERDIDILLNMAERLHDGNY